MSSPLKPASKHDEESSKASEPMSTYVPVEVGECIRDDARADDRSESYIIAHILKRHYARRVAAKNAGNPAQRKAA